MANDGDVVRREREKQEGRGRNWLGIVIRFILAAVVLMITAAVTPGFEAMNFGTALVAALIIAALDYIIQRLFKVDASPFGRGLSGFILSAVIIYITQFFISDMNVNILGAMIAALIIGIIDAIIPTNVI